MPLRALSQGAPKGRQQKGETGPGTHIFADFCRFSLIFGSLRKSRDLGVADLCRKPQETADFRRKPQKTADFCRNRFLPFAVSLLARSYSRLAMRTCPPDSLQGQGMWAWMNYFEVPATAFFYTRESYGEGPRSFGSALRES